ncbi:MAG: pilus assembly protein TadG-related protein [Actinomycetota bacterium]
MLAFLGARGGERGSALVLVALWLPVLFGFMILVADVGNWFVHKRHLQMQADAGALASGGAFTVPCNDSPIVAGARQYAGDPGAPGSYNRQVSNQANVHVLVNSTSYWNEGGADYSDGGPPCAAKMVDLKLTEANLPLFFGLIPGLSVVPAINARARVQVQQLSYASGSLPIAVPDVDPTRARVTFINETTGAVLASTPLNNTGVANGLSIWDNSAAPLSVPVNTSDIGVRVTLGGGASTTCGDPLVDCYDSGSSNGIVHVRGWSSAGSGAQPNPPLARDVTLVPGSCTDPYFSSASSSCTIGVSAVVDFGPLGPTPVGGTVRAVVGGVNRPLTYNTGNGRWESTGNNYFPIGSGVGPVPVEVTWAETIGTVGGKVCRNGGNNPCQGSFGTVQRTFSGSDPRSGPIRLAQVWESGSFWANSFQTGSTHDLVVKIGLVPNLQNAQDVNDPIVSLRVVGGSQNQSLDCDPNYSNLYQELAFGCRSRYTPNTGTVCPSTASALWGTPEPWPCVAIQTGGATNQVPRGLNLRILGSEQPSTCTSPNNWSMFPALPAGDPRVLNVFITPFGSFGGSGNTVVPVTKFGTFYVTGWTAQGGGFRNPCQGNGDDPVPNGEAGNIVGHFIKYVYGLNDGGGSGELCDFDSFGSCISVLTE